MRRARSTSAVATASRRGPALVGVPAAVSMTAALVLGVGAAALAAPLSVTSTLGAGRADVTPCGDLALARTGYGVTAGTVRSVVVSAVPTGCEGARLQVTLVSSTGAALATAGPVAVNGGLARFTTLSAAPAPSAVARVHVVAVGP